MSFELYITNQIRRQKQFSPFIPFFSDDCKLPNCIASVFEWESDKLFFEKRGIVCRNYITDPQTVRIPGTIYGAIPYSGGVIVQSDITVRSDMKGLAYVGIKDKKIDLLVDTLTGGITLPYDLLLCSYQFICADAGALLMHASAVMYKGEAILFCGVSGAGKSTQSGHWVKYYDAEPINYDHPCIIWDDDTPIAYGTPWGGKEKYCQPVGAPVKAIVFVHKNEHSSIRKLTKGEAFSRLALNNAFPHVYSELDQKFYKTIERLVNRVPVFHQEGTLTREAPDVLHKELYGTL